RRVDDAAGRRQPGRGASAALTARIAEGGARRRGLGRRGGGGRRPRLPGRLPTCLSIRLGGRLGRAGAAVRAGGAPREEHSPAKQDAADHEAGHDAVPGVPRCFPHAVVTAAGSSAVPPRWSRSRSSPAAPRSRTASTRTQARRTPAARQPDALDSGFHCARTRWILGFIAFQLARRARPVMLMVPVCPESRFLGPWRAASWRQAILTVSPPRGSCRRQGLGRRVALRYVPLISVCQAGGMEPTNGRPHVVIVGGGISGLAAAFFLRDEAVRVTVLEGSPRLGGKLSVSEIAGAAVD